MINRSGPLRGITICYVSTEAYGGVWRTYKQARTLADAGARVVVAGFEGMIPGPLTRKPFEVVAVKGPARCSAMMRHPWLFVSTVAAYMRNRLLGAKRRGERPPASQRLRHRLLSDSVARVGADIVQAIDLVSLECAHAAAHESGARLIYASNELWSEFVRNSDTGISAGVARHLLAIERELIGDADLVIAVSDPMAQQMVRQYDIQPPLVLLNAPPQKVDAVRSVSTPVRLVFHGGLSNDRNLDGLIRAMQGLSDVATLDIHGGGRTISVDALKELVDELGLSAAVTFHGPFDYEGIVELLATYDVGVWTAPMDHVFSIALANKLFDSICAGLAVATGCSTAVRDILESAACGVCVETRCPETIARDLRALLVDPERILAMKRAAVDAAPRYWWPVQGERLVDAIRAMLGR